jgi:hypothetical protein
LAKSKKRKAAGLEQHKQNIRAKKVKNKKRKSPSLPKKYSKGK